MDYSFFNHMRSLVKPSQIIAAYTINNEQPVRCTIIGEDPLRYLDDAPVEKGLADMAGVTDPSQGKDL